MSVLLLIVLLVLVVVVIGTVGPRYRVRRSGGSALYTADETVYEDEVIERRPRMGGEVVEEVIEDDGFGPPPSPRRGWGA